MVILLAGADASAWRPIQTRLTRHPPRARVCWEASASPPTAAVGRRRRQHLRARVYNDLGIWFAPSTDRIGSSARPPGTDSVLTPLPLAADKQAVSPLTTMRYSGV
jgi:hypothetical protein